MVLNPDSFPTHPSPLSKRKFRSRNKIFHPWWNSPVYRGEKQQAQKSCFRYGSLHLPLYYLSRSQKVCIRVQQTFKRHKTTVRESLYHGSSWKAFPSSSILQFGALSWSETNAARRICLQDSKNKLIYKWLHCNTVSQIKE